jgi:hypothetical protein
MAGEAGEPDQDQVERGGVLIPRWVKVFVLVALAIALVLLAHVLIGSGSHGPSLHGFSTVAHVGAAMADAGTMAPW